MAPKLKLQHSMLPGLAMTQLGPKRGKTFTMVTADRGEKRLGGNNRNWQKEAYALLKDMRFAFCTAFCGSGKSILQVYLAAYDYIQSDFTQRQLFIVPQSVIANGFVSDGEANHIGLRLNNRPYSWQISHNFCDSRAGVLDKLEAWLLSPVGARYRKLGTEGVLTGGLAIATHQAFNLVWKRLTNSEKKRALHNLTLRIDEAHHIKGVFDQLDDDYTRDQKRTLETEATNLGRVCRAILDSPDSTCKLHLTTATPYRGDRGIMLSPKARERFKSYFLPWLVHWNTLGIEAFSINYEEYTKDPFDLVIDRVQVEPKEFHMIVVPAMNNKWRQGVRAYDRFLRKLYSIVPKDRVLDLVTGPTQGRNKILLSKEPKNVAAGTPKYSVVITCMIGREGLDWVPCSRLHNTAVERSLTLAVQTTGRPLRSYGTKKKVAIYNYIQRLPKHITQAQKRQLFSDRSNGILLGMQWDALSEQILIPTIPTEVNGDRRMIGLQEVFGHFYPSAMAALIEEVTSLECLTDAGVDMACASVLESFPSLVACDEEVLIEQLRQVILRRNQRSQSLDLQEKLRLKGIDIAFLREAGFDRVVAKYGLDNRAWFSGEHSKEDWEAIRKIVRSKVRRFEEQCRKAEVYLGRVGKAA